MTEGGIHMADEYTIAVEANQAHLIGWLEALERAGLQDYVKDWAAVPDAEGVRHNSENWCGRVFRPDFNPYRQTGKVDLSASPARPDTFDVLRHEYSVQGMRLEVLETVRFMVVRFEMSSTLSQLDEQEKRRAISRTAAGVLNVSGDFRFPPTTSEWYLFSTRPEANPITLVAWTDRVDGGIRNGRLFFVCYKRIEPTDGKPVFLNGAHWFDGKCWEMAEPRAR